LECIISACYATGFVQRAFYYEFSLVHLEYDVLHRILYLHTKLYGVSFWKTIIFIFTAVGILHVFYFGLCLILKLAKGSIICQDEQCWGIANTCALLPYEGQRGCGE
jgi:hypothetical protein